MPSSQLRILVPLKTPATESPLVRLAASLVFPGQGELHLTHVLVPHDPPPTAIERQLDTAARSAREMGISTFCHLEEEANVTRAIEQAIARCNCNMMAMGWTGAVEPGAILAATNRGLTKSLKIDTLIFKNRDFRPARRILVPTAGGSHFMMALQVAHDLARRWDAELEVLRIARDERCQAGDPLLDRYCSQLLEETRIQLELADIEAPVTILPAREVVAPIVSRVRQQQSELVVMGASNDWRQDDYLAGSIPDEIASQVPCSVLMVRSAGNGKRSLSDIFWGNTIRLDLHPKDKWEAITQMVDALVAEKQIPESERDMVLEAAFSRERIAPTAMGHQTAIPHAPISDLPAIIGCMGICPQGVDFTGAEHELVRFIFLLLTPQQNYRNYIPILAQIASLIRHPGAREALLSCQIPSEITALLKAREQG